MIVHQDVDVHHALERTRHSANALETLEQLTNMEQWNNQMRKEQLDHSRMSWRDHAQQLIHEGLFVNEYTMSYEAHSELVEILCPYLQRKECYSRISEPIAVEHMVAAGLRHLQGGRIKDARHIVKCSRAACYAMVIDVVNSAPELAPKMLMNGGQLMRAFGAEALTTQWVELLLLLTDSSSDVIGRVQKKLTIQILITPAITNRSTNDIVSYALAESLKVMIDSLPPGLYFLADAAFRLGEKLLTPFVGPQRHRNPYNDAYYFYLSQLRIRVEMAFGRLVNKFRILSGKINGRLSRVSAILTACARLHNYIIQRDGPCDEMTVGMSTSEEETFLQIRPDNTAPLGMSYLPTIPDASYIFDTKDGNSHTRAEIVEFLSRNSLQRPVHNLLRRRRELAAEQQQKAMDAGWVFSQNGVGEVYAVAREYISPN
ncbi:hypothetical protein HJC23_001869 [Cyclotella cryptica]|uniref:DDE Tnp4 domain-containing protein n=1 Tax=Cyclotella cryptica TaxID=29204 RepID=A0ABD3Q0D7_9STRA